jgi:hypothetical protein
VSLFKNLFANQLIFTKMDSTVVFFKFLNAIINFIYEKTGISIFIWLIMGFLIICVIYSIRRKDPRPLFTPPPQNLNRAPVFESPQPMTTSSAPPTPKRSSRSDRIYTTQPEVRFVDIDHDISSTMDTGNKHLTKLKEKMTSMHVRLNSFEQLLASRTDLETITARITSIEDRVLGFIKHNTHISTIENHLELSSDFSNYLNSTIPKAVAGKICDLESKLNSCHGQINTVRDEITHHVSNSFDNFTTNLGNLHGEVEGRFADIGVRLDSLLQQVNLISSQDSTPNLHPVTTDKSNLVIVSGHIPPPKFNQDLETASNFLHELELYFKQKKVHQDERLLHLSSIFKGNDELELWWLRTKLIVGNWEGFIDHFTQMFGSLSDKASALERLYSRRQKEGEPFQKFALEMELQYLKVNGSESVDGDEKIIINFISERALPAIRSHLLSANASSIYDLIQLARKIELSHPAPVPNNSISSPTQKPVSNEPKPTQTPRNKFNGTNARKPFRCNNCNGIFYNFHDITSCTKPNAREAHTPQSQSSNPKNTNIGSTPKTKSHNPGNEKKQ